MENSLANIFLKTAHRLKREKMLKKYKKHGEDTCVECESLDRALVKHLSILG